MSTLFWPTGAVFDLSDRAKLRLTGSDRVRFLNGQVTNDIRKAAPDLAVHACVITAKGKLNGDLFVSAQPDFLLLDLEADLRENLPARLERYLIADDVQIEDVTDQFALFHTTAQPEIRPNETIVRADRWATSGWDLWVAADQRAVLWALLQETLTGYDAAAAERLRIELGIPRWGRELSEEIIPIEAGLEASSIDYAKGCYIGQEVISRMKMSGQTNKRLCGLESENGEQLAAGSRLTTSDAEGKDVGWLTSAMWSERLGKWIALGYAKRGFNDAGTTLIAITAEQKAIPVRVTGLPFG